MPDHPNIDPRLAKYADVDPQKFKPECMTAMVELSTMFKTPAQGQNGADVSLKQLFAAVDANEDLIDYKGDNHQNPAMRGNSSSSEWAAFALGAVGYAKTHPEFDLRLGANGSAPQIDAAMQQQIIAAGRVIYDKYTQLRSLDQIMHAPLVAPDTGRGRGGRD